MTVSRKESDEGANKYTAPALSKGLDILELLASRAEGMRKSDIAKSLDRSISEIFRMLAVLNEREYVSFDPATERYSLTTKLFEIAHRHPPVRRLSSIAIDTMRKLALDVNQSVHLAILHGDDILIIAQVDAPGNNVTSVRLGARVPITITASGAVLFSSLPPKEREKLLDRTRQKEPELVDTFRRNVENFEKLGWCESVSEVIEGVHNMSVPVRDYSGTIVAALTIPFINRLRTDHFLPIGDTRARLIEAGRTISELLGSRASAAGSADSP
ncbi:IclR family transcriptional regulator [Oricola thermophila]|uniref:IclR family transcriptional regulator n=1 Tax=Oricola thermophila TaxID=2742145 RepID=A0A6N1VEI1_9HYPH|nr:IclR family transcriptional regulator [Oricola thermophila]QKV19088.1 IclR family transcriptional regulator [Oricola thermophila]